KIRVYLQAQAAITMRFLDFLSEIHTIDGIKMDFQDSPQYDSQYDFQEDPQEDSQEESSLNNEAIMMEMILQYHIITCT
ncbi:11622_t:CDS:2, partial [Gigaspora rosea]